jgi:hypothetical protein
VSGIKASDLPASFRECRACHRIVESRTCTVCGKPTTPIDAIPRPTEPKPAQSDATPTKVSTRPEPRKRQDGARKGICEPNKTEAEYRRLHLTPDARYEALTFRFTNGHRYTPDWVVTRPDGAIECHEVKGGYRFGSHQRARLAFDQARVEWPGMVWVWATRGKRGEWEIEK